MEYCSIKYPFKKDARKTPQYLHTKYQLTKSLLSFLVIVLFEESLFDISTIIACPKTELKLIEILTIISHTTDWKIDLTKKAIIIQERQFNKPQIII